MSKPDAKPEQPSLPPSLTDEMIEDGEDLSAYMTNPRVVGATALPALCPVVIELPVSMVQAIDRAAEHLAMRRETLIESWLAERLEPSAH